MNKSVQFLCGCFLVFSLISCEYFDFHGHGDAEEITSSTSDVYNIDFTKVIGTSTLRRAENRIMVDFETSDLIEGHAYTLWWVVWNKPENCGGFPSSCTVPDLQVADLVEVELLFTGNGFIADDRGTVSFSAVLMENDTTESVNELLGMSSFGGLVDARTAEVHVVIRSHGPAIDGMEYEQISSYEGGCAVNFPPFTEIPDAKGECGDMQAAIFQPE